MKLRNDSVRRHKQFITDKMIRLERHAYSPPSGGVGFRFGARAEVLLCDGSHVHV